MRTKTSLTLVGLALGGLLSFGAGCGPSAASLCSRVCECTGCNESEEADCVDDIEDTEKLAEDNDCGAEFDDYLSCFDSELECRDGNIDADGCSTELTALFKCGSSSGGNDEDSGSPAN